MLCQAVAQARTYSKAAVSDIAMAHPPPAFTMDDPAGETPNTRDPAPSYQAEHHEDIWARWTAVDRASRRVTEIQVKLARLEPELQSQTKEFERMKEKR